MSHWQPGTTIQDGRYKIAKILGYGGSGVTYRAQENSTGDWVANKRPRRKQRGIATLFLTFHAPQGAGNSPVILLKP
jgi:serine/threonine protein kinase